MNKVYCYCCYCYCLGWLSDCHLPLPHPRPLFPSLNSQNKNPQSTINALHQQVRWWNIDRSTQRVIFPFSGASVLGRWQFINRTDRGRTGHQDTYSLLAYTRTRSGVPHWLVQLSLAISCFFFSSGVFSFAVMSTTISPVSTLFSPYFSSSRRSRLHSQFSSGDKCFVCLNLFIFVGVYVPCIYLPARWELP